MTLWDNGDKGLRQRNGFRRVVNTNERSMKADKEEGGRGVDGVDT